MSPANEEEEISHRKFRGVTVRDSQFPESYDEYLECIYRLSLKNPGGYVKNKDISERLNVKAPSVTNMLEKLSKAELINWTPRKGIKLTPIGRERAKLIVSYHVVIELFLARILGMKNKEEIDKIACDFEHHFTPELKSRLVDLLGIEDEITNIDNFIYEDRFPKHIETQKLIPLNHVNKLLDSFENEILETIDETMDMTKFQSILKEKLSELRNQF